MATTSTLRPRIGPRRAARSRARFDIRKIPASLHLWHLTSLDAPTVAVVWTLAFAWAAHLRLPIWLPVVIALAAWSAYIGDRLLDARNARTPLRARHLFHWEHRRIFLPIAVAAALIGLALVLHSMPSSARGRNSFLAAAALVYFTSVHSPWRVARPKLGLRLPKEFLVGVIFTLACATPTWARIPGHRLSLYAPIVIFIALAWLNCHAIEAWESDTAVQRAPIVRLAAILAVSAALIAIVAASLHDPRSAALLAAATLSAAMLAMLDRYRLALAPVTLRAAADLVLLVPAALLAIR
ncbi:hypothetical protein [Acidicapsa acidisoli]|uniref:hypothetical protein n=1 Tax=Acidicapsa acidisoli TaxID=1615681 RepID=UPI0021DFEBD5|nr:hypothetical protein [Acidicapsa acidisoli]